VEEDAPWHCGVEEWRAACGARASTSVGLKMAMQDRCLLSQCTFAQVHVAYYESGYPNQVKHVKYFALPLHPRCYDTTSLWHPLACLVGHLGMMTY